MNKELQEEVAELNEVQLQHVFILCTRNGSTHEDRLSTPDKETGAAIHIVSDEMTYKEMWPYLQGRIDQALSA
jgi:hypothetical protein